MCQVLGATAMVRILGLVIKHAEQISKCETARTYCISCGKCPKVETAQTETFRFCVKVVICMDSEQDGMCFVQQLP
jgi:hypothetical protein